MFSMTRKWYFLLASWFIILVSLILMVVFKRMGEMSRLEIHDVYFNIARLFFSLAVGYVIIRWFFILWKSYRQLKVDKAEAELSLLKSNINPHFFFNTLNNLYGLTLEKSDDAPEVILKLSDIMRYTIYEGEKATVLLKDEINYIERFLEIHAIRYKKQVDISFKKNILNGELEVAPLLFIILIENAIKHGVETILDQAFIDISMNASNKRVMFSVRNNFEPREGSKPGIGLKNLERRLQLIYPKKHELEVHTKETEYIAMLNIKIA